MAADEFPGCGCGCGCAALGIADVSIARVPLNVVETVPIVTLLVQGVFRIGDAPLAGSDSS